MDTYAGDVATYKTLDLKNAVHMVIQRVVVSIRYVPNMTGR